ncbi:EamA domain-containing membrane protein RarD [Devosia lucknowensis]|uniref:EamA domain-containing membrane protein RarD n=1 Tax=Devosia lucknowensis TaxID=1096929 RepID=A0A1Y6E9A5_9HYPH|nr:DMT family transporter [Devosia lucknowensis]SMQ59178.1 EamA domain-containing membrane protein RarD [Devosia lucknowensis]
MTAPVDAPDHSPSPHRIGGPLRGILLKVASVCCFVVMATMLKATVTVPSGQMVFFRSFFAMLPVLAWLAWNRRLAHAFQTKRPIGHVVRGLVGVASMSLGFFALTRLPLPEATAIGYASPIIIVILSAVLLQERVYIFRWTTVIVGLVGVMIILWPRLTVFSGGDGLADTEAIGAIAALMAAFLTAFAMLQVRTLVQTERTEAIVTYFFISASILSLLTLPFGWIWPTPEQTALLIGAGVFGGIGQLLLTNCYRHADMSVIAPFEYVSLILTIVIGFVIFADVPTPTMVVGALIIVGSGIAVILRERWLGLDRARAREANTP